MMPISVSYHYGNKLLQTTQIYYHTVLKIRGLNSAYCVNSVGRLTPLEAQRKQGKPVCLQFSVSTGHWHSLAHGHFLMSLQFLVSVVTSATTDSDTLPSFLLRSRIAFPFQVLNLIMLVKTLLQCVLVTFLIAVTKYLKLLRNNLKETFIYWLMVGRVGGNREVCIMHPGSRERRLEERLRQDIAHKDTPSRTYFLQVGPISHFSPPPNNAIMH
jgi:hypothetical protein